MSTSKLPLALGEIKPPLKPLTFSGNTDLLNDGVRVAVIGSRTATADSQAIARTISYELASTGITIVSGLARGIDTIAHQAALDAGGKTIGVLATGLGDIYPRSNRKLAQKMTNCATADKRGVLASSDISARGLLVTEYGAGTTEVRKYCFPRRNHIIAALSDYLVIVQAHPKSGSMITAHAALDLGVPIGITPIALHEESFHGSRLLIRDGADTVIDGYSVLKRLAMHQIIDDKFLDQMEKAQKEARADAESKNMLLSYLSTPRLDAELAELTGREIDDVRAELLDLEQQKFIEFLPEGYWIQTDRKVETLLVK